MVLTLLLELCRFTLQDFRQLQVFRLIVTAPSDSRDLVFDLRDAFEMFNRDGPPLALRRVEIVFDSRGKMLASNYLSEDTVMWYLGEAETVLLGPVYSAKVVTVVYFPRLKRDAVRQCISLLQWGAYPSAGRHHALKVEAPFTGEQRGMHVPCSSPTHSL